MRLQVTNRCYEHIPERVINIKGTTIMWDEPVVTIEQYLQTNLIQYCMIKKRRLAY